MDISSVIEALQKWSHYEDALRVPLIISDPRAPKSQRGRRSPMPLRSISTFLLHSLTGLVHRSPRATKALSLKPIIEKGKPIDWREETFHEHFAVRNRIPAFEGLRNHRYKYVRYFDHGNYEFLHDLKNDPDELKNLAEVSSYASVLKAMRIRTQKRVDELGGALDPSRCLHQDH